VLRRLAPVMVVILAVLAACQSAPTYSNPTDIITKGLDATAALKSFHVSLSLSGTFSMPGSGASFKLDSTSLEADVDIPAKQAHLTFAVPAFLGLTGEVLLIGQDLYVKTSMTGDKWMHKTNVVASSASPSESASVSPSASLDTASMIKVVKDFLAKDGVKTTKLADVDCGDRKCYQVSVSIPSSLMTAAGAVASMDPSSVFGEALVLNLLFDREKLWLTEASTDVTSATLGTFSAKVSFSKFDEAVTVSPPPSADVTEGEFTLPGM
jgi:hypothetical protein